MTRGSWKQSVHPVTINSMSDLADLVHNTIVEQSNTLAPNVVGIQAICSPDVVFRIAGFPAAGSNSTRFASAEQVSGLVPESSTPVAQSLEVMTAQEILDASRDPEYWRNLTKFVTEDVARNVASADGYRYTYRNRDKQTLKNGVRSKSLIRPRPE